MVTFVLRVGILCALGACARRSRGPGPDASTERAAVLRGAAFVSAVQLGGEGEVDPSAVRRVLRAAEPAFARCHGLALALDPAATGRAAVRFAIDGEGRAVRAEVSAPTVAPAGPCVAEALAALAFPRPTTGEVTVQALVDLGPPEEVPQRGTP